MVQETFDAPCIEGGGVGGGKEYSEKQQELEERAHFFLQNKARVFGARVEKKYNPHDFGMYPSFELFVDEPHDIDSCYACGNDEKCEDYDKDPDNEEYNKLWDSINALHDAYYKKFKGYL